jgi:redox-sensitive bicupin YhaK (pirin superfamily)
MGNGSVIRAGDVQRMSAGRGVQHSEFNHSPDELVHFLQIWMLPATSGIEPGYEEKHFDSASKRGTLRLIASPDGREGSLRIHQDAAVYAALLDGAERLSHPLVSGSCVYVHVARGEVTVNGQPLAAGDALKAEGEPELVLEHGRAAEVLVFDLP